MKKVFLGIALAVLTAFTFTTGAFADEAAPAAAASKPVTTVDDIKNLLGLSIYLQGGYNYNFANPESKENDLRIFDHKANTFTLDLAELVFNKDAAVGGIGYRLKLSAGETAKFIHAAGLGDSNDSFDLTEAYVQYVAPLGKGLKFQFGKFVTFTGAEVIEAEDNMNYSRGLLFNYAIPLTHTGLMIGYPFSDKFGVNLYVLNGWDNFDKNDGGSKTLGLNINITPADQFSAVINFLNGRETDLQTGMRSNRFLSDTVITVKPVKNLTFVLNPDYGIQSGSAPDGGDAKWYGVAGYVKYDFSDLFSSTVRAEYFKDADGARIIPGDVRDDGLAILPTPEFRVAKNLVVRPEYRHDWADKNVFDSHNNTLDKKSQDTIALGVMYRW
jgi:Putative beta-barrel porin-2, OmpL-like. bbp2